MSGPIDMQTRFVGYDGCRGFDDGYDWMEGRIRQGWSPVPSWGRDGWDLGDWPCVVYAVRYCNGGYELAEYCEGDETRWTFATSDDREAFVDPIALRSFRQNGIAGVPAEGEPVPEMFRGPYGRARAEAAP